MSAKTVFEKYTRDYLKFDQVEPKLSSRPDLHAFLMLDALFPGTQSVVAAADHEIIYLAFDEEQLDTLGESVLRDLHRCGVSVGSDGVYMFV